MSPPPVRFGSAMVKDTKGARLHRGLREIRVYAAPSWDAAEVTLTFWFVRHDETTPAFGGARPLLRGC